MCDIGKRSVGREESWEAEAKNWDEVNCLYMVFCFSSIGLPDTENPSKY